VVAAEEENAPDSAGPVRGTPAGPRVSTRARGSVSVPADEAGEAADTDSLGSAPAGSGTQSRFSKKQVRDQILKITTLLERTQKTLKVSDRWIEAGVLVRNHGLDATQTALESVLDLLELRLKKLEAARASSSRLVPQATINLLRVLLDDLTQLASLEPANPAIDWVDKRKALGTILGVNLRVDRSRMVRPGPTNPGQAETAAETKTGSGPGAGSGTAPELEPEPGLELIPDLEDPLRPQQPLRALDLETHLEPGTEPAPELDPLLCSGLALVQTLFF
jgi:hypothetical protein